MDKEDNKGQTKSKIAEREEEILKFWQDNKIFEKSLEKESPKGNFVFYEGPPTANGKPGIHHIEARAFKDIVPRYKTMKGYFVRRKAGWDTHGLPVELQVEKQLGLKSKKEIEKFGIAEFNKKCRESVWEYVDLWDKFTKRIGYWVDEKNAYITYKNEYIESVWNILASVNDKKLLYKDYKVVPWCPRCGTALSSHELAQGYQDDKDLAVTVKFKVVGEENTYLLAWTTTPWTLPGNVALAVGKDFDYIKVKIRDENQNDFYVILSKKVYENSKDKNHALYKFFGSSIDYGRKDGNDLGDIVKEYKGSELVGLGYEPLFSFFQDNFEFQNLDKTRAYKVYLADFVNTEEGTGIVHTAVMYGQDDFELGTKVGLPKFHLVNPEGKFIKGTGFLEDRFVKEVDENGKPTLAVDIIENLKKRNLFFSQENIRHSYPHCWRCKTPLIYYARDSWYIRMSDLREELVKENESINWVPSHIKTGRFGEWLREVKDWAISRERYWGTPLPIWQNAVGKNFVIGSIEELKKYTKKSSNKYWTMRHGEAKSNVVNISDFAGDPENHLTENGQNEVKNSALNLKKLNIDLIILSPFLRTRETAAILQKELNLKDDSLIIDERIHETTLNEDDNDMHMRKRMGEFIFDIEYKYKNKNILILSHGSPLFTLSEIVNAESANLDKEVEYPGTAEVKELNFVNFPHNENYELDLHRPYIDEVELLDEEGNLLKRTKEVMDVWFDSGAMPFAQDGLARRENSLYPADYISEAIDQTRGWFYTLHAIGILMGKGKAYKNVVCLGHILDTEGKKMSKSVGNIVDPWLMMDKYGVDALRLWMYTVNQPGDSKNFDEKTVDEIVKKIFNPIENIISFYELYKNDDHDYTKKSEHILDKWIIARLNILVKDGGERLDKFQIFEAGRAIRDFVTDFSTWYIRRSRDRFKSEDMEDRENALTTTRYVLLEMSKYLAPFMPFFAESIYLKLRLETDPESVHLYSWPDGGEINEGILENMEEVRKIVSLALEKRMAAEIKVRQPLSKLKVKSEKLNDKEEYLGLIKDEVNVKEVVFNKDLEDEVELDTEITEELQKEGNARDFIRVVQDLRKTGNLTPNQKITLLVETDDVGKEFVQSVESQIKKPTNVSEIVFADNNGVELKIEDYKLKIKIK